MKSPFHLGVTSETTQWLLQVVRGAAQPPGMWSTRCGRACLHRARHRGRCEGAGLPNSTLGPSEALRKVVRWVGKHKESLYLSFLFVRSSKITSENRNPSPTTRFCLQRLREFPLFLQGVRIGQGLGSARKKGFAPPSFLRDISALPPTHDRQSAFLSGEPGTPD